MHLMLSKSPLQQTEQSLPFDFPTLKVLILPVHYATFLDDIFWIIKKILGFISSLKVVKKHLKILYTAIAVENVY